MVSTHFNNAQQSLWRLRSHRMPKMASTLHQERVSPDTVSQVIKASPASSIIEPTQSWAALDSIFTSFVAARTDNAAVSDEHKAAVRVGECSLRPSRPVGRLQEHEPAKRRLEGAAQDRSHHCSLEGFLGRPQGVAAATSVSADRSAASAHGSAEQDFAMLDIGESAAAVETLAVPRCIAERTASRHLRVWLTAAHGEALARSAFDRRADRVPIASSWSIETALSPIAVMTRVVATDRMTWSAYRSAISSAVSWPSGRYQTAVPRAIDRIPKVVVWASTGRITPAAMSRLTQSSNIASTPWRSATIRSLCWPSRSRISLYATIVWF